VWKNCVRRVENLPDKYINVLIINTHMVKIRKASLKDLRNYLKYQLEAFPTENRERHKKYFKQKIKRDEIFVLELNEKYLGHLTYSKFISPPFVNSLYAEELIIGKVHRNKGYGTLLLDKLVKEARKLKIERILLDTWNNNKNKAIKFYLRHGFKRVGEIKTRYGNEAFYELYVDKWK
jgi:ribosomal protein S18 acetylase RimI-like enzyme